jgi:hypothetical protein
MPGKDKQVRPRNPRDSKLVWLLAALGEFLLTVAICNGASSMQDTTEPIWPTKD